MITFIFDYK